LSETLLDQQLEKALINEERGEEAARMENEMKISNSKARFTYPPTTTRRFAILAPTLHLIDEKASIEIYLRKAS
jgi:hypothetical protein